MIAVKYGLPVFYLKQIFIINSLFKRIHIKNDRNDENETPVLSYVTLANKAYIIDFNNETVFVDTTVLCKWI